MKTRCLICQHVAEVRPGFTVDCPACGMLIIGPAKIPRTSANFTGILLLVLWYLILLSAAVRIYQVYFN